MGNREGSREGGGNEAGGDGSEEQRRKGWQGKEWRDGRRGTEQGGGKEGMRRKGGNLAPMVFSKSRRLCDPSTGSAFFE